MNKHKINLNAFIYIWQSKTLKQFQHGVIIVFLVVAYHRRFEKADFDKKNKNIVHVM